VDALDVLGDTAQGSTNRLVSVPLGDGTYHITVLHSGASQREHCW
jgi:hypothetical protein